MRLSMRLSAPHSIRLSVKITNNNQLMEESEGMDSDLTVGRLDPLQYRQHHPMSVLRRVSQPHPHLHHHHHPQGFHIHQQHQFSVQPQRLTVSLLVEIQHQQDSHQLTLNMDPLLSVILNLAMVEMEDHHQDPHQLALNMDPLLTVILNLAIVEMDKMIMDLL